MNVSMSMMTNKKLQSKKNVCQTTARLTTQTMKSGIHPTPFIFILIAYIQCDGFRVLLII